MTTRWERVALAGAIATAIGVLGPWGSRGASASLAPSAEVELAVASPVGLSAAAVAAAGLAVLALWLLGGRRGATAAAGLGVVVLGVGALSIEPAAEVVSALELAAGTPTTGRYLVLVGGTAMVVGGVDGRRKRG